MESGHGKGVVYKSFPLHFVHLCPWKLDLSHILNIGDMTENILRGGLGKAGIGVQGHRVRLAES